MQAAPGLRSQHFGGELSLTCAGLLSPEQVAVLEGMRRLRVESKMPKRGGKVVEASEEANVASIPFERLRQ